MSRLKLHQRRKAREVARSAWIESEGDCEAAEIAFKYDPRVQGLDPSTLMLLLQIALQLWKWWSENKIVEPSVVSSLEEPIDMEADDEG